MSRIAYFLSLLTGLLLGGCQKIPPQVMASLPSTVDQIDFTLMGQEPGSNQEIAQFCRLNFGVSFPLAQKISVKGGEIHPLYAYLTSAETNPEFAGAISWNFNKFLLGRDGRVLARFGSSTKPNDGELVASIESALGS